MSFDVAVQRGEANFGALPEIGGDTENVSITAVSALSAAFAFLRATQNSSSGPTSPVSVNKNSDDLSMSCLLQAVDNVRLTRLAASQNADYQGNWEVWEYIGDAGGPNEFIIREHAVVIVDGAVATLNYDISAVGVSDFTKLVPIVCGYTDESTGLTWNQRPTLRIDTSAEEVIFERTDTTTRVAVYYALVEFTGSNWQVEQNVSHTYSFPASDETETITSIVDWDTAFIFSSHHTDQVGLNEIGWTVRPGSTVTTVRFRMRGGATIAGDDERTIAFVVRNPACAVTHEDSISGSQLELAAGALSQNWTISAISNPISATGILGSADCRGAAASYPRPWWAYDLVSATTITWRRGRSGQRSGAVAQVIEFPQRLVEGDVSAGARTATVTIDVDKISRTDIAVTAVTARAAVFNVDMISQPTVAVEVFAGPATVTFDTDEISQTDMAVFVGLATVTIDVDKISQTDMAVFADLARTVITDIGRGPAHPYPPLVVFGPDVDHLAVSPSVLTVVTAHPTSYLVTRKTSDTVLAEARESGVISPEEFTVFAPETTHLVVFQPSR